ncbi:MAG: disulfide oxidoreductase [Alphaproteobacteria bacterium]|nr:disulfide oxidoreductase [Alphaproteobacteria bacterium]
MAYIKYMTQLYAMLGPTNTGKTYYAIERMASYKTGMIGFPLRLLARENYDRMVTLKGRSKVALITGEEKIIPPLAQYYICTVEAMPVSLSVDFLCVDEIQLCADSERGHIFTDRLLRARGEEETLFLGSLTMRQMIQRLLPDCRIQTRERFSALTYNGYRKLTRLPPRSAIVAFNVNDVYRLAEMIRVQRGGAAIVLGALSPRTRNAQVEMYQKGEVDYLVATDAIGMGLNMDIDHVALGAMRKFDGHKSRGLHAHEVAQIAGRAGRYRSPGTFGVTDHVDAIPPEIVNAVENHQFDSVTQLRWRNPNLDFRSIDHLLHSLSETPSKEYFTPARQADDHLALQALSRNPKIRSIASSRDMVRLLWEVCAIPDFRKTLIDEHHRLLEQIYLFVSQPPYILPEDWYSEQIKRLDRYDGDLDTLLNRIAYIRTWTYITHIREWLKDAEHWQAVSRLIEDKLSDALHERLTQRFVDKRTSSLLRGLASRDKLLGGVKNDGTVIVEGHVIGRLQGWHFMAEETLLNADGDAVMRTARAVLKEPLQDAISVFPQQVSAAFSLDDAGHILWRRGEDNFPIAQLVKGTNFYQPKIRLLHTELLDEPQNKIVLARLEAWLNEQSEKHFAPLVALRDAEIKGTGKGLAFQLYERTGLMLRSELTELLTGLEKEERPALNKLGIRLGAYYVYQKDILKPAALHLKAVLWRLFNNGDISATPLPKSGNVSMAAPENASTAFYSAMGFPAFGKTCVRVDMVERLNSAVFDGAVEGKYKFDPALASTIGVSVETVQSILAELGFRFDDVSETTGEGEEAVTTTTRFYHVRKKPVRLPQEKKEAAPRTERPQNVERAPRSERPQNADRAAEKPAFDRSHKKKPRTDFKKPDEAPKSKAITGYNAFAELAALKKK